MISANFNDYPPILQAKHVRELLGISVGKTYELFHSQEFPTFFVTPTRMVVVKDDFITWLNSPKRRIKRIPILDYDTPKKRNGGKKNG